jgi:transcriptional regulator with XRE-family HTH domain/tetratricopeptide (TPR) repeat protein
VTAKAGHLRLRELRMDAGWTQNQLAEKLAYLAWTRGKQHAAVNGNMVAKWESGTKGISARYRIMLCDLFGVTAEQLGIAPPPVDTPLPPVRDTESLIAMLDKAGALLDQLGATGTALAPQMLSAWQDTATSRRTMLGLLDPAATDPAGHARALTATTTDLEQLAGRYHELHATADPVALLTPVAAHVQMATDALRQDPPPAERRRLLRNLAQVATLAGRLAYEDLGDALSGRAHYAQALDAAREAGDHQAAAVALGHTAQLAHAEGMTTAALDHLTAASVHAERAPAVAPWLATIAASVHADRGDHAAARDAFHRAHATTRAQLAAPAAPEHSSAHLMAVAGHVHLQAGDHATARDALTTALDQLPGTARRARILALVDLATAELHAGNHPEACRHATTAAAQLARTPYAAGTARLRTFRAAAATPLGPRALRLLDQHLSHLAA